MTTNAETPIHVVIPARYASERLPGKPLVDIGGEPMIAWVARAAAAADVTDVTVATDDHRIVAALEERGIAVELTSSQHQSGSDRVHEVAQRRGWAVDDIVLNVQGDEPLLPPAMINQVAQCLVHDPALKACTLREPIRSASDFADPNCVKVVVDAHDQALLFSRAPVPYSRGNYDRFRATGDYGMRHIGLYGYRLGTLDQFVGLPPSPLEQQESLEQLRLLENGIGLQVLLACCTAPVGVDTPEDLERVRTMVATKP